MSARTSSDIADTGAVSSSVSAGPDADATLLCHAFDPSFYLRTNRDVATSGADPLQHFLQLGWREGRDPAPWFSTSRYLRAYRDVREAGLNPFLHYLRFGRDEGRTAGIWANTPQPQDPAGPTGKPEPAPPGAPGTEAVAETIAPHFDTRHYLAANPDVARAGVDPVAHYAAVGWKEGRDPSREFSTRYYLDSNPDIRAQGINPFWHFIVSGRAEGRLPTEPGGYKARILKMLRPLEQTVASWRRPAREAVVHSPTSLTTALKNSAPGPLRRMIVSLTHDNHQQNTGGVQLCVAREEQAALAAGYTYVALHPWQPLPRLAKRGESSDLLVNLIVNGTFTGTARMADVTIALAQVTGEEIPCSLVVHSLLGHATEAVTELARAVRPDGAWFWLHDNFSTCPSFALQRNGISYCGAPPPASQACAICLYGAERREHLPRMAQMFRQTPFTVVSPSSFQLSHWASQVDFETQGTEILPHLALDWSSPPPRTERPAGGAVKVAFGGVPSAIKGWPVFEEIARRFSGSGDYRFYYFGTDEARSPEITARQVAVAGGNWTAMRDALAREQIDLFVHWPAWPETFSFTTYEAIAAGAAVITHPRSGNVAAVVDETGCGRILGDAPDLAAFFGSGDARAFAEARRQSTPRAAGLRFSRMTIDLIEGEHANGDSLLHKLHV